jgi:hypothetical protein
MCREVLDIIMVAVILNTWTLGMLLEKSFAAVALCTLNFWSQLSQL